jgi:alkylation response protein AidB-like acyl-CoA dehydrogenase
MTTYQAPVRDVEFLLNDVFEMERYSNIAGFGEATPDLVRAILEEGAKFCEEVIHPLNAVGDREGCVLNDGVVTTPTGFADAYRRFAEGGWPTLCADPEHGGQGLPLTIGVVLSEFIAGANMAFGMYPGLSRGAYEALAKHGTPEQKATYLPRLASGEWTGTMNLTEPHCGTDLGLMRTRAEPRGDGSYAITGTKIFISAGEHDLADNIVHLVLAKIPGGPEGIKGVSLFVVPKVLVAADGSLGARNAVSCGALEEKMGIHGNSTCVMNYDGATGWLVGGEHKGMRAMFTMMNAARLGVGIQGLAQSELAYQNARAYARDRRQGRALTGAKAPDQPADPIIVHPDIRRILMNIKAFNEGARALVLWSALREDVAERSADEDDRARAEDHMGLLMPVIKGVLTDTGFANAAAAQQVFGGHGYIRESGMEQIVRDARIAMIYEGANGIQALDLVGRKLPADGGRALRAFLAEVGAFLAEAGAEESMAGYVGPLASAVEDLQDAVGWLMKNGTANPDEAAAGSTDFMHMFGLVALAYMWAMMARKAQAGLTNGDGDRAFLENKLVTGAYFMQRLLPETKAHLARIVSGAASVMALDADAF